MKLSGALLILLGSLLAGRQYALARRRELQCLSTLCAALERMEAELSTRALPLPDLIVLLAVETKKPAAAFFSALDRLLSSLGERSFRELWQEAAQSTLPQLSCRERDVFCDLGAALGRYPLEKQTDAMRRCREQLFARREAASRSLRDDLRLGWGLSAGLGFLLWILLI